MTKRRIPVRLRSLVQRINRKLGRDGKTLMAARAGNAREELGADYFVAGGGSPPVGVKDIEALARKIGALRDFEELR